MRVEPNSFSKNKRNHVNFHDVSPLRSRALLGKLLAKVPVFHGPVVQNSIPERIILTFFFPREYARFQKKLQFVPRSGRLFREAESF